MPKTIVVMGTDGSLGGLLAARIAVTSQDALLVCATERAEASPATIGPWLGALLAASSFAPAAAESFAGRLRVLDLSSVDEPATSALDGADRLDEVWIVGPTQGLTARAPKTPRPPQLPALRRLLRGRVVGVVNHVSTAYVVGDKSGTVREGISEALGEANNAEEAAEQAAERDVVAWCREEGIPLRVFRPAMLVGAALALGGAPAAGIHGLLASIFQLKALVDAKSPDYLQRNPLRIVTTPGAGPNLIPVERAIDRMLSIARDPSVTDGCFHVASPENTPPERLSRYISSVSGLKVSWVSAGSALSSVDSLLAAHAATSACYVRQSKHFDGASANQAAATESSTFAAKPEQDLVEGAYSDWSASAERASREAAQVDVTLTRKTLRCEDGGELEYRIGGVGPVVVCVNAMGQDISIWSRLIAALLPRHRIVYYGPRGTYGALPRPFTLMDQVLDLERLLDHEEIRECRIVAWCSGAKVGLELLRRRPTMGAGMVILGGAFRPLVGLNRLETAFEGKLLQMCQMVNRQAEMASLVKGFMEAMFLNDAHAAADEEENDVLGQASRELRTSFIQPFSDLQSTRNYSRQVVDYMSHDIGVALAEVTTPILLVGGELDQIASPKMSEAISKLLPSGRYVEIGGGTHYCLFENAETLAPVIEDFFEPAGSARPE